MCQVLIHTPWLALGARDWNALCGGVVKQVLTTLELVVEDWVSPWSDDLDGGLEGVEGEFETDLVVALAGATVRDGKAAFLLGDCNLGTGDDWAGEGGTEKVDVLVDGVAGNGWIAELLDEL